MRHRSMTPAVLALVGIWIGVAMSTPVLAAPAPAASNPATNSPETVPATTPPATSTHGASTEASVPASSTAIQGPSPAAVPAAQIGATPATTQVQIDVSLQLRDPSGAQALEQEVSDPTSASYRKYLTPAQWEARFSPTESSVDAVTAWLKAQGISVEAETPDRLTIEASASAATIEKAFATGLGEFHRGSHTVRLATQALKAPSNLAPLISGVGGVDENLARPDDLTESAAPRKAPTPASGDSIPPPPGFRTASPCSDYYGQKIDTTDPPFGNFPHPLPYAPCGYTPAQLQGAYGLSPAIAGGIDGSGVTVAIVDAYVASTLFNDAHEYSEKNQPGEVLEPAQFSEMIDKPFNQLGVCEAPEWSGEQTLDVEAVHATAPGAHILYFGARNCTTGLYRAVHQIVDGHLAQIITDSWGTNGGDVVESAGSRRAFDNVLLMAGGTGIGVQFSAGDEGDEYVNFGLSTADYPPSSPYVTSVGGTTLEVGASNTRIGEYGWSTSKSVLCIPLLIEAAAGCTRNRLEKWAPEAPGRFDYGGGGGTSYSYPEPWYQEGVVPAALGERNKSVTKTSNRVEPDISMDADPSTGMLVGETQEFPDGVYYDQYRIGGTSLSSPLFAGVMADADQKAGTALGFVNPLLYRIDASPAAPSAFFDIVKGEKLALARVDYANSINEQEGLIRQVRVIEYKGVEYFCKGAQGCEHQNVSLGTGPGFDSMTGIGVPNEGLLAALATP